MTRSIAARSAFFRLLESASAPGVFNPWHDSNTQDDAAGNGPKARRDRLQAHLAAVATDYVLIGEASGYQGCRITGIPFTSERLVMAGAIPRLGATGARLSTRHIPWSEPSATTVWSTLAELGIAERTVLWNAFPWHPHRPGEPHSNRTPGPAERERGLAVLQALLALFPQVEVFAVGRHAEQALLDIGRIATSLRHPSMGGALRFRAGLSAALRSRRRTS